MKRTFRRHKNIVIKLTERQNKIYKYIVDFYKENHFYPIFKKIAKDNGLKSITNVQYYMKIIEDKGWFKRHKKRGALRIYDVEEKEYTYCPHCGKKI